MARTIEQHLAAIRKVDGAPASHDVLCAALAFDKPGVGIAVAAAAKRIAEFRLEALVPELVAAFERLVPDGPKRDPNCRGKIEIARTLHALDIWEDAVLVRGLHVVQLEGPPDEVTRIREDVAAELRGICGLAHAHFARADALDQLARLLADGYRLARLAAAQALGDCGRPDATALLRYFLLASDEPEPDVVAAAFESLFALDRDGATAFAIDMLANPDERGEAAALALGGARAIEALDALAAWCDGCRPEQRHRVGYLALALLRDDRANALLLEAITTRATADAIAAATALATFRDDANVLDQLRVAQRKVDDTHVSAAIAAMIDG